MGSEVHEVKRYRMDSSRKTGTRMCFTMGGKLMIFQEYRKFVLKIVMKEDGANDESGIAVLGLYEGSRSGMRIDLLLW